MPVFLESVDRELGYGPETEGGPESMPNSNLFVFDCTAKAIMKGLLVYNLASSAWIHARSLPLARLSMDCLSSSTALLIFLLHLFVVSNQIWQRCHLGCAPTVSQWAVAMPMSRMKETRDRSPTWCSRGPSLPCANCSTHTTTLSKLEHCSRGMRTFSIS